MADDTGGYLEGLANTPVGAGWGMNLSPNDPLYDWYSRLGPDDMAKFLQDPEGHAQEQAAKGNPPPSPEAMRSIHAINGQNGTPSDPFRFDQSAEGTSPFDVNTYTGKMEAPRGDRTLIGSAAFPGGTEPGTSPGPQRDEGKVYVPGKGYVDRPQADQAQREAQPGLLEKGKEIWRRGFGTQQPEQAAPPATAPAQPATGPTTTGPATPVTVPGPPNVVQRPPGADLDQQQPQQTAADRERERKKKLQNPTTTDEKVQAAGDAISELGKAMQGVKGPEPLRPPSSFAPAPHPTAAPNIAALLGALGQARAGQVPPSAMPILRTLGR